MKKQYSLDNNLGQLEVNQNFTGTKFKASLNGQLLGEFEEKEAKNGKDFELPDGSKLTIKFVRSLFSAETQVERNGQPISDSPSDPRQRVKTAVGVTYFIGASNLAVYLIAQFLWQQLFEYGINFDVVIEGAIFVILGYFMSKGKVWAGGAALTLFSIDTVLMFVDLASSGHQNIGSLIIKIVFWTYLFRGFAALRELKAIANNMREVAGNQQTTNSS